MNICFVFFIDFLIILGVFLYLLLNIVIVIKEISVIINNEKISDKSIIFCVDFFLGFGLYNIFFGFWNCWWWVGLFIIGICVVLCLGWFDLCLLICFVRFFFFKGIVIVFILLSL